MKKRIALLITSLIITNAAFANYGFNDASDFTGEAFFTPPDAPIESKKQTSGSSNKTVPPVKQLRLMLQDKIEKKESKNFELAPTAADTYAGEIETSEYASKDVEEEFEEMTPDGFESDEESIQETKKEKKRFFKRKNKL